MQLYGQDELPEESSDEKPQIAEEQLPFANAVVVIQDIWTNGLRAIDQVGNRDGRITAEDNQLFYPAQVQEILARTDINIEAFRAGVSVPLTRTISQFDRDGIPGLSGQESQNVLASFASAAQAPVTHPGTITTQVMIDTRIGAVTLPESPTDTPAAPATGEAIRR